MNWKKLLPDPSLWALLIVNIWLVYYYLQRPQIFTTLIWLYWSQSVLLGFFNFVEMVTAREYDLTGYSVEDSQDKKETLANATAWLFLFLFGGFHVVYTVFLFTIPKSGPFDWAFYEKFLLIFFVFQVFNFIQHKIQNRNKPVKINKLFGTPFIRAVPMHLCIIISAFLPKSSLIVFLLIKVFADVAMYIVTANNYKKDSPLVTATTMNTDSTISQQ